MRSEPLWLTPEEVVRINRSMVDAGEVHFLKSPDLLESACQRAFNLWSYEGEDDIVILACRVLFSIAGIQAFEQGNKRTGFTAALTFLRNNGFEFSGPDYVQFAEDLVAVVERRTTEQQFATLMAPFVSDPDEVS